MGWACSMYKGNYKCAQFSQKFERAETTWEIKAWMGRIILKYTLQKQHVQIWSGFNWIMAGLMVEYCVRGNHSSGSAKVGNFLIS